MMNKESFSGLSRKELQKICKKNGIKANLKTSELVDRLEEHFSQTAKDEKDLESGLHLTDGKTNLRDELLEEIDRRANDKMSKIPRIVPLPVKTQPDFLSPARFEKSHNKLVKSMDSIDVYLAKKKSRADLISMATKTKPVKNVKRASPRLSALAELNHRNVERSRGRTVKTPTNKLNLTTCGDLRGSQFTKRTPLKFDLQTSLTKPLKYTPHRGKLKQVYFADSARSVAARKKAKNDAPKLSVKDNSKKLSTRTDRRATTNKTRTGKRDNALAKRRGMEA